MKKIFLAAFVIISFVLYAWTIRVKGASQITTIITSVPSKPTLSKTNSQPSSLSSAPTAIPQPQGQFKDGTYTGSVADAFYGPLQVKVTISGSKISDVQFLQAPSDRPESVQINNQADPMLAQEAIQAQSAQVDVVSGATQTSQAFVQTMQSALIQAKS
jgi:uncharacterized protein with FMN-binding domain